VEVQVLFRPPLIFDMNKIEITPLEELVPYEPSFRELFPLVVDEVGIENINTDYNMIARSVAKSMGGKAFAVLFVGNNLRAKEAYVTYIGPGYDCGVDKADTDHVSLPIK
jgi:hypothetical protein